MDNFLLSPWRSWMFAVIFSYPVLAMALRYRRIKSMQAHYNYISRESLAQMTDQEAYEIMTVLNELEFPAMYEKALQYALFRTYGIPSISKLLVKTGQLTTSKNVGKRYADTAVLLCEMFGNQPNSERAIEGFARLNYLHGHYIKQGKITNDDMLYTLALFMTQPVEWINMHEWRTLTDLEVCAMGVFHKSMGDTMLISYDKLPSGKTGFKDGLEFYDQLSTWALEYEMAYMIPHQDNYLTAIETKRLFLSTQPRFMHNTLQSILSAAMDDRLRRAIKFEEPTTFATSLLHNFLRLRKYFLRYLALPRPSFLKSQMVNDEADSEGRRTFSQYSTLPYYVKPTLMNRWGPESWLSRWMGQPLPGDEGYAPEGFKTSDVGPSIFTGKGYEEAEKTKERLRRERTGGCPFPISR